MLTFRSFLLVCMMGICAPCIAYAATAEEVIRNDNEDIRLAIVKTIGASNQSVKIAIKANVFKVLRVNSNMIKSNHAGVNNEATAIASVVSKNIAEKPEYNNIIAIRIEYVKQSGTTNKNKIMDSVNFRKNQDGTFKLHIT